MGERFLGKEEAIGSIPIWSFRTTERLTERNKASILQELKEVCSTLSVAGRLDDSLCCSVTSGSSNSLAESLGTAVSVTNPKPCKDEEFQRCGEQSPRPRLREVKVLTGTYFSLCWRTKTLDEQRKQDCSAITILVLITMAW